MTEVISSRVSVARKDHRCDSCGKRICAGQKYLSLFCCDGGETYTWKEHDHCRRAVECVVANGDPVDYEDGYPSVSSLEYDDREIVLVDDPEAFMLVWGDA